MVGRSFFWSVRATAKAIALTGVLWGGGALASTSAATTTSAIVEHDAPFKPQNGGRDVRSLSVNPNGREWLFVECPEQKKGCDVMRYDLASNKLYRFALPAGYSYSYAHYSPQGTYILMSRHPISAGTEDDPRRAIKESELLIMRSDGSDLQVVPVADGVKFSPFMSSDEKRIAFWRSERVLPPGRSLALLDFDVWEYDLTSKTEKLFAGKKFKFVMGGELTYLNSDEILLNSYGPSSRFSTSDYQTRYRRSEIFRLTRGQINEPTPILYPNVWNADQPSMDLQGNTFIWGSGIRDRVLGVMRISLDNSQTMWRTRSIFVAKYLMVDPNGQYVAAIYWDMPLSREHRLGGFAKLDLEKNAWSEVFVPRWDQAEPIVVSAR